MQNERYRAAVLAFLVALTVVALLPMNPAIPLDARNFQAVEGMTLEYPTWAGLLEPLVAPAHFFAGAPDFRLAFLATLFWLVAGSLVWGWLRGGPWRTRLVRILVFPVLAVWCLAAYALFVSHVHFPGWRLEVKGADLVIADLQTHTLGSWDGLARAPANLAWHESRGFNLIAVTEHDDPSGSFYAQALADKKYPSMAVIPGVEIRSEFGSFLLGLGMREGVPFPKLEKDEPLRGGFSGHFASAVHDRHRGAVISMAWHLEEEDVPALVQAGIDGFEILNSGHPDISPGVREAMLEMEGAGKVVLVASSDWHGWGGLNRTWTVIRVPGAEKMTSAQRAAAAVRTFRARDTAAVTPIVAGYMGPPSVWRLAFTPFSEAARYASELSWPRVLGWWLWGVVLLFAIPRFARRGMNAVHLAAAALMGGIGGTLAWRGWVIYSSAWEGDVVLSRVTSELGGMAIYTGLPLLLGALGWLVWEWRRGKGRG